jgi:alcohol dehydrogenase class IV
VGGAGSFAAPAPAAALPALRSRTTVARWSDFAPNTDAADLVRGLAVMAEVKPDLVLGVGGGSAMDMAKLLCAYPTVTGADELQRAIRAGEPVRSRAPHLVLAPTTSGSGSEATHFAVVYIGSEKFSVAGPAMLPDAVILDPLLTLSGSRYQRATSGIDAIAQAIESLWAAGATPDSRRYARHALGHLLPAIEEFVRAPAAPAARAMAIGSHLAGRAINISKTTAAHALSYGITKGYGVSHGHAVALTLGAFIEAHACAQPEQLQPTVTPEQHGAAMMAIQEAFGVHSAKAARKAFETTVTRIGLGLGLTNVGVSGVDAIAALARSANVERLGNNPVRLTEAGLIDVLQDASGEGVAPAGPAERGGSR